MNLIKILYFLFISSVKLMTLRAPIKPLVLVGPSGSGRAAIAFRLTCDIPHKFAKLISMTSRKPRPF